VAGHDRPTRSREQQRWDRYGADRLAALAADPERFVVTAPPYARMPFVQGLVGALGSVDGKQILELGCGFGTLSVFLAKQGARVTGVDIGARLVEAADKLAELNGIDAQFARVDIKSLPFASESFDVVVGLAVLHHLSERDLASALAETHRVLRRDGTAMFTEPVEDSRTFDFVQNLVPAGKPGDPHYRPSRLNRRAWARHIAADDQRSLTTRELRRGGDAPWSSVSFAPYGLTSRLERVLPQRIRSSLWALDRVLLERIPPLRRFCRTVLARYEK
jgi:SAM-dependent methyltransferase